MRGNGGRYGDEFISSIIMNDGKKAARHFDKERRPGELYDQE